MGGAVASALRQKLNPDIYRSTNILGADCDLAAFCDTLAEAGVLACEPGEFSYGLGNTVLGRVIEVRCWHQSVRVITHGRVTVPRAPPAPPLPAPSQTGGVHDCVPRREPLPRREPQTPF